MAGVSSLAAGWLAVSPESHGPTFLLRSSPTTVDQCLQTLFTQEQWFPKCSVMLIMGCFNAVRSHLQYHKAAATTRHMRVVDPPTCTLGGKLAEIENYLENVCM